MSIFKRRISDSDGQTTSASVASAAAEGPVGAAVAAVGAALADGEVGPSAVAQVAPPAEAECSSHG